MDQIEESARRESPAAASDVAPPFAVPPRVYALLALLILAYVLPPVLRRVLPSLAHPHHATSEGELSEKDFERYLSAESSVRIGFFVRDSSFGQLRSRIGSSQNNDAVTLRTTKTEKRKNGTTAETTTTFTHTVSVKPVASPPPARKVSSVEDFGDAIGDYRALSGTTHAPNMDRRVLILTHALGKPFDEAALKSLTANLKLAKTSDGDIAAETALWRELYAPAPVPAMAKSVPAMNVLPAETRIRGMHLRFLEDRALADLYERAGQPNARKTALARLHAVAQRTFVKYAIQVGLVMLAGLAGFVLLIVFLMAASGKNWQMVRRVATAPVRMRWGTLLECFLFYLAFYRFLGVVVGMLLTASDWQPDPHQALLLNAGLQIGTGAIAVLYTRWLARQNYSTLETICLTTRGNLIGNIGYGILGYCATLPLLLVAGIVARAIFRHNTNTTPNPVLPLMVGTHDPLSRVLIFLMASIAAPFFEEIFFRGVLFTALRLRWGWVVSAAISGVCFALVHPMQDWIPIFVMGFTFATMREMRQSLVPSMTAHFLQNTLSFLMLSSLFST